MNIEKLNDIVKLIYIGKIENKEWPHFLWSVKIGNEVFEYKAGLGHAKRNGTPERPKILVIVQCLVSDMECGQYSFNDFCDNIGCDRDSIKALDVYRSCMDGAEKLRKAFGKDLQSVIELVQSERDAGNI